MPSDDLLLLVLENMKNSSKVRRELKLEGYPDDEVQSCLVYAIEKNLIEGKLFRPISGAIEPLPQRLTAYGQDFIEQLQSKKREASAVQNAAANPSRNKPIELDNKKSISLTTIAEGVIAALVVACILYLIAQNYGLRLQP